MFRFGGMPGEGGYARLVAVSERPVHQRRYRTRSAVLGAFLSFLFALPVAQPALLAAVPGGDHMVPVVDDAVGATSLAEVPTDTTALLADFDGDHNTDLFWYGPGAKDDHLWLGRPDRNFVGVPVEVNGTYLPLLGDFNGNGRADILWYGPGTAPDVLWYGQAGGGFAGQAVTVNGTYQPIVGDFNGNGRADILWYGPGTAPDVLWYGQAGGGFAGQAIDIAGTYQPFTGDFDGDGSHDIFWYEPGAGADVVWYGQSGGFSEVATPVQGTYQPLVGDFGGNGPNDVLWWAPGAPNDVLWFGHTDRRFTSRSTTVDLDYARALAIRPDTITNQYNPYGFVAHAMGAIDGHTYSNSLEAFQRNYGRGFRVFECDQVLLADGTVLVAHDGLEANYGLNKPFQEATWADLAGHKYLGLYTILRSQDILQLLIDHPDIYLIPDSKYSRPEIFRTYVRQATALGRLDVLQRLMPHVADQAELNDLRVYFPLQNYVLALYHTQALNRYDDPEAEDFVRRNRTPAVMMWWRERDFSISLAANGLQGRRFRQAFADSLRAAGAVVYVHNLSDPVEIQRFWDLGIGVYSDEPFPPLGTTTPTLKTPTFSTRTEKVTPPA
jgi:hypothetical protein